MKTPKCDSATKQVILPCREMCHDWLNGCSSTHNFSDSRINCDYLPSLNGDMPCLYERVSCNEPPNVQYATVSKQFMPKGQHYLYDTARYFCSEGFKLEGNEVVQCMYSGQWSTPPKWFPVTKSFVESTTQILTINTVFLYTDNIDVTVSNSSNKIS